MTTIIKYPSRFTLSDLDRYAIAQIQQEAGLTFERAQLLHQYRNKRNLSLCASELRFCEALEDRIALAKAERAFPLRNANANGSGNGSINWTPPPRETEEAEPAAPMSRIDLARYDSEPLPVRAWGVLDRFPRHAACLLSGEGGRGKSIILLQLAVAHVLGRDWLRSMPEPGPVVLVNAEDTEDEIIRRLKPILEHYGATFADIAGDLHIFSLAGADSLLAVPERRNGRVVATARYDELMTLVSDVQPVCIILDNLADVSAVNEIDRAQVRQFIALMRQIAIAANGYTIMSSHPSLTGIASKTGMSGSTQWHNSVRARAWLHGGETNNGEAPDPDLRVLEFLKSNYSRLAETITLRWQDGLYVPVSRQGFLDEAAANAAANDLFLTLLDRFARNNRRVSEKKSANNYAPTVFAAESEAKRGHITKPVFEDAMRRLFAAEQIALEPYGPPCRDYRCIIRKAAR